MHARTHARTHTLHNFLSTTWPDMTRPSKYYTALVSALSMHAQSVLPTTVPTSWAALHLDPSLMPGVDG